jgi:hypothetical protein
MRGLAMEWDEWTPSEQFPNQIVSVICDKGAPFEDVKKAIEACPWDDVCWVHRERDMVAEQVFADLGIEAVKMPLNPWHKTDRVDNRRFVREFDMMYGSTHILVFRNEKSDVSKHWLNRLSPRAEIHVFPWRPKK